MRLKNTSSLRKLVRRIVERFWHGCFNGWTWTILEIFASLNDSMIRSLNEYVSCPAWATRSEHMVTEHAVRNG